MPGLEIRIVDPSTGEDLPERQVGELEIRGTSVTPGYYKRPDATAELFHDGWLRTGDLAYLLDGELVMCGRIKDVIIVGGRNVFPEDIERAVGTLDGVRAGNVIAFGVEGYKGKESVVVVAETKGGDHEAMRRRSTTGCATSSASRRGHRAGGAGHPAEDQLRQAAARQVPRALPRGDARARLTAELRPLRRSLRASQVPSVAEPGRTRPGFGGQAGQAALEGGITPRQRSGSLA